MQKGSRELAAAVLAARDKHRAAWQEYGRRPCLATATAHRQAYHLLAGLLEQLATLPAGSSEWQAVAGDPALAEALGVYL
jgi:hypothetical protein